MPPPTTSRLPGALAVFLAVLVTLSSASLAYAHWLTGSGSPAGLQQAARWWPHNADWQLRLAEAGPQHEKEYLARALAARPRSADTLISLSLVAESEGDPEAARRWIARAVAADRSFRPVWARMNLLARLGDQQDFWPTARAAFAMSHRDRQALFDLCWTMRPDGLFLIREVTGRRPPVLLEATTFLMRQADLAAARVAFHLLLDQPYLSAAQTNAGRIATAGERRQVGLDLCDLQLHQGNTSGAWQIWAALAQRHLLKQPPQRGFAWRRPPEVPTGIELSPAGSGWVASFTGDQPDNSLLLWRYLPPKPPGRYRVHAEVSPEAKEPLTFPAEVVFTGAALPQRFEMRYQRKPGTIPLRGTVRMGELNLERLDAK